VYFGLAYEGDDDSRLMIRSYEYLGLNREPPGDVGDHLFRYLGSDDELVITERQLNIVLTLPELIEALGRVRDGTYPKLNDPAPKGHAS
jgi:hypothetical protein